MIPKVWDSGPPLTTVGRVVFIPSESWRGFHSDRDLTPEEVEQLPQFAAFVLDS
jgi:hypothetical protein